MRRSSPFRRCALWLRYSIVDAIFYIRELLDSPKSAPRKWRPILDVDPLEKRWLPATFGFLDTTVDASESARIATITIIATRGVDETIPLSVQLTSTDGTATSKDNASFTSVSTEFKFPSASANSLQTLTYDVKVTDQFTSHDTESFTVELTSLRPGTDFIGAGTVTITIPPKAVPPGTWVPIPWPLRPDPWLRPWLPAGPFQIDPLSGGIHNTITIDPGFSRELPDDGRLIDPGIYVYGGGDIRNIDPGYWINQIPQFKPRQNPYLFGSSSSYGTWRGWDTGVDPYPGVGFDLGQFNSDFGVNQNGNGRNIDPGFYPPSWRLPSTGGNWSGPFVPGAGGGIQLLPMPLPNPLMPIDLGPQKTLPMPNTPFGPWGPNLEAMGGNSWMNGSIYPWSTIPAQGNSVDPRFGPTTGWTWMPPSDPWPYQGPSSSGGYKQLPSPASPSPITPFDPTLPWKIPATSGGANGALEPMPWGGQNNFSGIALYGNQVNGYAGIGRSPAYGGNSILPMPMGPGANPYPYSPTMPMPYSPYPNPSGGNSYWPAPAAPSPITPYYPTVSWLDSGMPRNGSPVEPMPWPGSYGPMSGSGWGSGLPGSPVPMPGGNWGGFAPTTLPMPYSPDPTSILGGFGPSLVMPQWPLQGPTGPVRLPDLRTPSPIDPSLSGGDPSNYWDFMRGPGWGGSSPTWNGPSIMPWVLPKQPWDPNSLLGGGNQIDPGILIGLGIDPRSIDPNFGGGSSIDPGFYPGFQKPWANLPQGLTFDSDGMDAKPTFLAEFPSGSDVAVPTDFNVRLTIDGQDPQGWQPFDNDAGRSKGDSYVLGQQLIEPVTEAGVYTYTLDLRAEFANMGDVWRRIVGTVMLLPAPSNSPFGNGWNYGGVNRLEIVDGYVILIFGQGGYRIYPPAVGNNYTSPPGDFGTLVYDPNTQTYIYTSPLGWKEIYDLNGNLIKRVEPRGSTLEYTYGDDDRLIKIKAPDDQFTTLNYAKDAKAIWRINTIALPGDRTVTFVLDDGSLISIELPDNSGPSFVYEGKHLTVQKWNDQIATLVYENNFVKEVQRGYWDGASKTSSTLIAPRDAQVTDTELAVKVTDETSALVTDAFQRHTSYTLDKDGRLLRLEPPGGVTLDFQYTDDGRLKQLIDPLGHITTYVYGGTLGYDVVKIIRSDGGSYVYDYGDLHRVERIVDPQGNVYTIIYAANGVDIEAVQYPTPSGTKTTTFTWDNGRIKTIKDPLNPISTFTYDDGFLRTLEARPNYLMTLTLDSVGLDGGLKQIIIDQLNRTTSATYDSMRRLVDLEEPGGGHYSITYNKNGWLTDYQDLNDPLGRKLIYVYDANGFLKAVQLDTPGTSPTVYTYAYDPLGNLVSKWDLWRGTSNASYGYWRLPDRITDPLGSKTDFQWDPTSPIKVITLPGGEKVTIVLDVRGRVGQVGTPDLALMTYSYDKWDRPILIKNPDNLTTTLLYTGDRLDKLIQQIDGSNSVTTSYVYDDFNRILKIQPGPRLPVTSFGYDPFNRVDRLIINAGTADQRLVTIVYDIAGRIVGYEDPDLGTTSLTYDPLNRPILLIQNYGQPDARTTSYLYDGPRLISIKSPDNSITSYAYDDFDRPTTIITGKLDGSSWIDPRTVTIIYDDTAFPKNFTLQVSPTQLFTITYDAGLLPKTLLAPMSQLTTFIYDDRHRISAIVDPRDVTTSIKYGPRGDVSEVIRDALNGSENGSLVYDFYRRPKASTDPFGIIGTYVYDGLGRPIQILHGNGGGPLQVLTFTYDPAGAWSILKTPADRVTSILFDDLGRPYQRIDPDGGTWTTQFDRVGRPLVITDPFSKLTTLTYDAYGNILTRKDPLGHTTIFTYDPKGRIATITDPTSKVLSITYDAFGGVTKIIEIGGGLSRTTSLQYDVTGNLILREDPIATTSMLYDALNRLTKLVHADGTADESITKYEYGPFGEWLQLTNPDGFVTSTSFDNLGRPNVVKIVLGGDDWTTSTEYLRGGRIGLITDPRGAVTSFVYDDLGRPWKITRAKTLGGSLEGTTVYTYDGIDRILSITDPLGTSTSLSYSKDAYGELVAQIENVGKASARTTITHYDLAKRVNWIKAPDLTVTSYIYDDAGQLIRTILNAGGASRTTSLVLDDNGRILSITAPTTVTTSFLYDGLGRKTKLIEDYGKSLARTTDYFYDDRDRLIAIVPPASTRVSYVYDRLDRLIQKIDDPLNLGDTTSWVFTPGGQILSLTNPNGVTSSFAYDALGRPTVAIKGFGVTGALTTNYKYDPEGLWATLEDPLGNITSTLYDKVGRPYQIINPNGAKWTKTFDLNDRIVAISDPYSKLTSLGYDAFGDVTSRIDPLLRTTEYTYTDLGQLLTITDPLNSKTSYLYDKFGNVLEITEDATGGLRRTMVYTYDGENNLLSRADSLAKTVYSYDHLNRLTQLVQGSGTSLAATTAYAYDPSGKWSSITDPHGHITSTAYDTLDRAISTTRAFGLTEAWKVSTAYLPGGQIDTITDPRGAVTAYDYDDFGRTWKITEANGKGGSLERTTVFTYDDGDRVLSIADGVGVVTSFAFDANSHVTQRIEDFGGLDRTTTTSYLLDGKILFIQAPDDVITSYGYDAAGQLTRLIEDYGIGGGYLNHVTTMVYDDGGRLLSIEAPTRVTTSYAYDALGRTRRLIEDYSGALQRTTSYSYDAADRMIEMIAPTGAVTSYSYDILGQMTTLVEDATSLKRTTTWKYDGGGNILSTTDPLGAVTSYAYDGLDRVTRIIEGFSAGSLQRTLTYAYDPAGLWSSVTRPLGASTKTTTSTVFDALGRTARITEDAGGSLQRTTTYLYDTSDRLLTVINPEGTETTYGYDALGQVTRIIEAYGLTSPLLQRTTTFAYDVAGRVLSITAPTSTITSFAFDALGRTTKVIEAYGLTSPMLQRTTSYAYSFNTSDGTAHLKITDPLNSVTSIAYDRLGRIRTLIEGHGVFNYTTTYAYSDVNRTVAITDALNHTATTFYDGLGRLTKSIDRTSAITTYLYAAAGNTAPTRIIDPNGFGTTYNYDVLGRVSSIKAPTGDVTTYLYDHADRQTGLINPLGHRGTLVYDVFDRLIARIDSLNHTTTYGYDVLDRLLTIKDAENYITTFSYDKLSRLTRLDQPEGVFATYAYDAGDRRISVADALNHRTTFVYDALGRNTKITDATSGVVTLSYDAGDNLLTLKDPNLNTTTFVYDILGRRTKMTDPQGHSASYAYDKLSRLISETDRASRRRDYGYDNEGRLSSETWVVPGLGTVETFAYEYDKAGNQTVASRSGGTVESSYLLSHDNLGRVQTVEGPWNTLLTFSYDSVGNRVGVEDNFGGLQTSTYDNANRLERREQLVGPMWIRLDYQYTARDQLMQVDRYWNTAEDYLEEEPSWSSKSDFEYDGNGATTQIRHYGTGEPFLTLSYAHDTVGRLSALSRNGAEASEYGYDPTNQLTDDEGELWYEYDAAGNRTEDVTGEYTIGGGNQLWGPGSFEYDAQGNLIRIKYDDGLEYEYGYDLRNQLAWETLEDADGPGMLWRVDYAYDAWGNLIQRSLTAYADNEPVGDPGVERYAVDGWKDSQDFWGNRQLFVGIENFDVWADLNSESGLVTQRVFGDGVDQVQARFDIENVRWYYADHQGSIVSTADAITGGMSETVIYSAFGVLVHGAQYDRYGFQGRELDFTTGMYYFRARWYEPETGRFTSEDPMGFAAGDYNLYRFVGNRPTIATDPSGMDESPTNKSSNNSPQSPSTSSPSVLGPQGFYVPATPAPQTPPPRTSYPAQFPYTPNGGYGGMPSNLPPTNTGYDYSPGGGNGPWGGQGGSGNVTHPPGQYSPSVPGSPAGPHQPSTTGRVLDWIANATIYLPYNIMTGIKDSHDQMQQEGFSKPASVGGAIPLTVAKTVQAIGEAFTRVAIGEGEIEDYLDVGATLLPVVGKAAKKIMGPTPPVGEKPPAHGPTKGTTTKGPPEAKAPGTPTNEPPPGSPTLPTPGSGLHRPYIRKWVRDEVEKRAPRTADGRLVDPNTSEPINGKPDLGHKPNHEYWREKAKAEAEGLTQEQFNDRMNNPDLYQLEDPASNRSHKFEQPKEGTRGDTPNSKRTGQ